MAPMEMGAAIHRALRTAHGQLLIAQGTQIKVVCEMPDGAQIDDTDWEFISVEAEPMGGPRH